MDSSFLLYQEKKETRLEFVSTLRRLEWNGNCSFSEGLSKIISYWEDRGFCWEKREKRFFFGRNDRSILKEQNRKGRDGNECAFFSQGTKEMAICSFRSRTTPKHTQGWVLRRFLPLTMIENSSLESENAVILYNAFMWAHVAWSF